MARVFVSSTYDDLKECRQRVRDALRRMGHEDVSMEHFVAKEAIELLEKQTFNLVITDIVMPVLNGIEVLLAAKRIDSHYPVIVITGYHSVDSVVRFVNLGGGGLHRQTVQRRPDPTDGGQGPSDAETEGGHGPRRAG